MILPGLLTVASKLLSDSRLDSFSDNLKTGNPWLLFAQRNATAREKLRESDFYSHIAGVLQIVVYSPHGYEVKYPFKVKGMACMFTQLDYSLSHNTVNKLVVLICVVYLNIASI